VYINRGTRAPQDYLPAIGDLALGARHLRFWVIEPQDIGTITMPDNVTILPRAPLARLLARSELLISGGGQNAIMAALQAGVPILGMTGPSAERYFNLSRVEAAGAGAIFAGPLDGTGLQDAVERLLLAEEFRTAAGKLSDELRRLPGPAGIADLLIGISR
jgi:UDP:flavonoid glycosyltransferase YjiC (YdhE family)